GKLKSKQWHSALPPADKDLPFPELAIVLGVSDADLLKKAGKEYRLAVNGLIDALGQVAPIGQFAIPEPEHKQVKGGEPFFYPLPEVLGLDAKLPPTAGVSSKVAAFTFSNDHATRLLTKTRLRLEGGPLGDVRRPLASATYINVAGIIDMGGGWLDYGLGLAG